MSAQHTPGPWFIWQELALQREGCCQEEIHDELLYDSEYGIYAGNPTECTRGLLTGHASHICDIESDDWDNEAGDKGTYLANARLIAAAPDLLEALKAIIADGVHSDVVPHLQDKARAAIAKAEGGAA
jgi:hypothetical protein